MTSKSTPNQPAATTTPNTTTASPPLLQRASTEPLPLNGFCIGKYSVGKALGKGTYSTVRLAVDAETQKQWAMKIVDKASINTAAKEERLSCEIGILKALQHGNVVRMREAIQSHTSYYIIMELATGGELARKILSEKKLGEETARRYFRQLMLGVQCCHSHGIAHRDLKPENLLLDENDCLKISDFGLASLQGTSSTPGRLSKGACGTPHYMAPEVLRCEEYDGTTADLWSCGVILYVMLTGNFPFSGKERAALFTEIKRGFYLLPKSLSLEARDLISSLMCVDPLRRPSATEVLRHSWLQDHMPTPALRAPIPTPQPRCGDAVASIRDAEKGLCCVRS